MAKTTIPLGVEGKVAGDLTVTATKVSDGTVFDTTGFTLEPGPLSSKSYLLGHAGVTERVSFYAYVTASPEFAVIGEWDPDMTTLLNRIGAFTGTGVNTVLGFFKAQLKKDAATPGDIGGTFNPATDSAEALAEKLVNGVTVLPGQIAEGVMDATVVVTEGVPLRIKQGDAKLYTFEFGSQWDCTGGKKIFFTAKKKENDAVAAISKECTVTTPATAAGNLGLVAADTSSLAVGEYFYEFKRRDADGVSNPGTIQDGKFIIGQDLS